MKVDILYFTYNRLNNTKITLPNLLKSTSYPFDLTIVDNGSSDDTSTYLKEVVNSYKQKINITLILNKNNEGLSKPTNAFWRKSKADLLGKIDNDILVEHGWLEKLVNAHKVIPNLAVVGGFHFFKHLLDYHKYKHNIYRYDNIKILRQTHIGGNYIVKRDILLKNGFLNITSFKLGGWTEYQSMLLNQDYIIGYYYPFIVFEQLQNAPDTYFKEVRGVSKKEYLEWTIRDAEYLLYGNWGW